MGSTTTDRLAGVTASLASKSPVRAATTANITLSGEQTIDGVAVVADDRVLVKDQTDGIENGIYDAKSGAWVRSLDFDGTRDVRSGTFVVVASGTAGAGTLWRITTADDITIGTTSIAFAIMTVDSASAFMLTVLDDGDAATALATLTAAGLGENNALTGANTHAGIETFNAQVRWKKGADIASASPLVLGTDGNYWDVTGTTGFSQITCTAGTFFMLQFNGALTMTDGANLDLGGINRTTVAGDRAVFFAVATDTAQLLHYYEEGFRLPKPDFTSSDQTVAFDTVLDVAHGLGVRPTLTQIILKCTTADHNFSVDDELSYISIFNTGEDDRGAIAFADTTNITIIQLQGVGLPDATGFNITDITASSWRWVVRCWI